MKKVKLISILGIIILGVITVTLQPKIVIAEGVTWYEHEGQCDCTDGSPSGDGYVCSDINAETKCVRNLENKIVPTDEHCYKDGHRGDADYYCDEENPT